MKCDSCCLERESVKHRYYGITLCDDCYLLPSQNTPETKSATLLSELKATVEKLEALTEAARGPGKHLVFMALVESRYHAKDALYAEEARLSKQ